MATYYIQQNLLTAKYPTIVRNEAGEPLYLMIGKWGNRGDVLSLYTLNGDLVAKVKQSRVAFKQGARFDLYLGAEKVGILHRFLQQYLDLYYIFKLKWWVVGNIPQHQYQIKRHNGMVMTMQKYYHATGDFYELDVTDDADAPLCICIASVLDYWLRNRSTQHSFISPNKVPNLDIQSFEKKTEKSDL